MDKKRSLKWASALLAAMLLLALCACSAEGTVSYTPEPAQDGAALTQQTPQTSEQAHAEKETADNNAPLTDTQARPAAGGALSDTAQTAQCTLSISCATALSYPDGLSEEKAALLPQDGWILAPETAAFTEGQSALDVLLAQAERAGISVTYQNDLDDPMAYVTSIGGLAELDCGERSGWLYRVNGQFPSVGCSQYAVQPGDVIAWEYTCDYGADLDAEA